ncbi:MAG: RHS repeat-associated core domain-containing protein [Pyrinomonadaceae bacterium]
MTTCTRADAGAGSNYTFLTQKERDIETGLDYFGYRYYGSPLGRWTSVDPLIDFKRNIVEPQAWNQYQYCVNNPLNRTDPDGQQDSIALNGTTRLYNDLINQGFTQQQAKEIVQVYRQVQAPGNIAAIAGLSLVGIAIAGPEVAAPVLGFLARNPGITEAVTALALEASGGPPGAVTGSVGSASKTELSLFQRLASEGKNVEVLGTAASKGIQGVRTADIAINGVKVEAKILEGVNGIATSGTVKNAIGRALGQSGNVLIDASGVKLTLQEAQRGAVRVFNADSRLKVVRVIGDGFDITLRRGPQRAQF